MAEEGDKDVKKEDSKDVNKDENDKSEQNINQTAEMMAGSKEESNHSEELIYTPPKSKSVRFNFYSADKYFHYSYENINYYFRYFIEIVVIATFLLAPLYLYAGLSAKVDITIDNFKGPGKKSDYFDRVFRFNVFFVLCYSVFTILFVLGEKSIHLLSKFLFFMEMNDDENALGVLATIYQQRDYWKNSFGFLFAFLLSNYMYDPFSRTRFVIPFTDNVYKTFILWLAIYYGMLFSIKFLVDVLTNKIKINAYRDRVRDLNYKTFIFYKLHLIAESKNSKSKIQNAPNILTGPIEDLQPEYDPGFYLSNRLFMTSETEAETIANNILVLLKKKKLTFHDIDKYFSENSKKVFKFLSGDIEFNPNTKINQTQFKESAKNLYIKRKSMRATLRDRDQIFNKLDAIFTIIVSYAGFIILLFMFKIDYKFFSAAIGGFLFSFSWIFADSIKNIYFCFLFLLVIRPFDIGDDVLIQGNYYKVVKIDLFTSAFITHSQTLTYMPNLVLMSNFIGNISRSPPLAELLKITVGEKTTFNQALNIKEGVEKKFKELNNAYKSCVLYKISKGELTYQIYYTKTYDSYETRRINREKLIKVVIKVLQQADVEFKHSFDFLS
ncbi:hypothetical protein NUSPORA_00070 [Nucleospora cyclopteri]